MGGDGHGFPYKVPDWKQYKVGAHTPELEHVERMLKSLGLKDPWLRNEVWRFDNRQSYVMTKYGRNRFYIRTFLHFSI